VDGVGRDTEDFGADALDLFKPVRKIDQFRRAYEREIERVEEQDKPLALVVRKLNVLGQRVEVFGRRHVEIRCRFADLGDRRRRRRFPCSFSSSCHV